LEKAAARMMSMSMMVKACADELFFFPIGAVKDSRRGLAKTVRPELVVEIGVLPEASLMPRRRGVVIWRRFCSCVSEDGVGIGFSIGVGVGIGIDVSIGISVGIGEDVGVGVGVEASAWMSL